MQYGDLVYRPSHPGSMAAIGTLFGIMPASFENCRVLELGCGTGFNLLAMSRSIPGGHFTGIDISDEQIRHGQETARSIGADNVELLYLSIDDFVPEADVAYDYIIAHGVYSWVPEKTRQTILSLIKRYLAPDGLAFISYNTNPGWRLRSLVRDALRFGSGTETSSAVDVQRGRERVDRLAASLVNPESTYSRAFAAEWENARENPDYYLAHEHLSAENRQYYFEEFIRDVARCELQFVAEARLTTNSFLQEREMTSKLDESAGKDIIKREQLLDWLVGRYFRQSILCHSKRELPPIPDRNAVLRLQLSSLTEILDRTETSLRIRRQDGAEYELSDPGYRAVLELLEPYGECPVPVSRLAEPILKALEAAGMDGPAKMPELAGPMIAALLWSGCAEGVWTIRADSPAVSPTPVAMPAACRLARFQAATQSECTNRLHRSVILTTEERDLLLLLDGTRTTGDIGAQTGKPEIEIYQLLGRLAALGLLIP